MKILFISPWFGNYRIPVFNYFRKLSNDNFYLLTSDEELSELVKSKLRKSLGEHVQLLRGQKKYIIGDLSSDFANKALVIKRQPGLYKAIKKISPDVVIVVGFGSWAPLGILYSILYRKKLCIVYERTEYVERNCSWFNTLYRRIIGKAADCFFINGMLCEDYVNKLGFKDVPKVKGCMVADSIELAKAVSRVSAEERASLKSQLSLMKGITYLFVGQMVVRKGIRELLSSWELHTKSHPEDNLIVIGSGVLKTELVEKFSHLCSVHILGGIPYDRIHFYYSICDVFIMPTLEDNWCLVVPEAMACGKAIACSIYNGGHLELVKDGINGFNFDPLNQNSILETLKSFHNYDLEKMGRESIRIEKLYGPDVATERMYNAMKELFSK